MRASFSAVQGEEVFDCGQAEAHKLKELYSDLKMAYPWSVYLVGYAQFAVYTAVWLYARQQLVDGGHLSWAILSGWACYCYWMVGHECYHGTMAPKKIINDYLGFLTIDCLVTSRETWKSTHNHIHHRTPYSEDPEDRQRLFGPCLLVETLHIIFTLLQYWCYDIADLLKNPRPFKAIAIVVKYWLLLKLPLNALAAFILSFAVVTNYSALLAHAVPVMTPTEDGVLHQLRTSLDLFPSSHLANFLSGALNNHAAHHIFPSLPRALHPSASLKLARLYPSEYRAVNDFTTLGALWVLRHKRFEHPVEIKDLPRLAEGKWAVQIGMDLGSVALLVAITAALPAFRFL